jgi:hypothetical protein
MKYVAAFLLVRFSSLRAIHSYWDFLLLLGSLSLSLSLAVFSLRKRTREHIFARIRSDSRGGVFDRLGESLEREREKEKTRVRARTVIFHLIFIVGEKREKKDLFFSSLFSRIFFEQRNSHVSFSLTVFYLNYYRRNSPVRNLRPPRTSRRFWPPRLRKLTTPSSPASCPKSKAKTSPL